MKVLSPNGGEIYHVGDTLIITWNNCNFSTNSKIGIGLLDMNRTSGEQGLPIARGISLSSGTYSYAIPATISAYGTKVNLNGVNSYKIVISDGMSGGGGGHVDVSDKTFSISQ